MHVFNIQLQKTVIKMFFLLLHAMHNLTFRVVHTEWRGSFGSNLSQNISKVTQSSDHIFIVFAWIIQLNWIYLYAKM